jgi:hypothetical protein
LTALETLFAHLRAMHRIGGKIAEWTTLRKNIGVKTNA